MHPEYDHLMESAEQGGGHFSGPITLEPPMCPSEHFETHNWKCPVCGWSFIGPTQMPESSHGVCQYCGKNWGRTHSGTIECGSCWDWRKHERAEARYWTFASHNLFQNEEGSGPDLNDMSLWNKWGIAKEVSDALTTFKNLHDRYATMLKEHNLICNHCPKEETNEVA